jgi:hypothetical protein
VEPNFLKNEKNIYPINFQSVIEKRRNPYNGSVFRLSRTDRKKQRMNCGESHVDQYVIALNQKMKKFWFEKLNIQYSPRM